MTECDSITVLSELVSMRAGVYEKKTVFYPVSDTLFIIFDGMCEERTIKYGY